jgi:hypothetical protein
MPNELTFVGDYEDENRRMKEQTTTEQWRI